MNNFEYSLELNGYLQDVRLSSNAVYTGCGFFPPSSLHTLETIEPNEPSCSEVELNIQSNTTNEADAILDTSQDAHTITKVGDPKHTSEVKVIGESSLYFDGNDDYLSINQSETLNLQGNFTLECWFNMQSEDTLK